MTSLLVWYGELTSSRRLGVRGAVLLLLPVAWLLFFLVFPSLVLVALCFAGRGPYGEILWQFTLRNLSRLLGFGILDWSADYLLILWRSVVVATVTTVVTILLAYPLACFIATRPPRARYVWLALVTVPFCTNLVIRTYAWMLIFSHSLPPAQLAQWLGLVPAGASLYPSAFAVYVGMVSSFLPFSVLPLYASIERMEWSIVEAAADLYASSVRVLYHAILPQTMPGLIAAVILTFIPALGAFVVPDLLGGAKYMLVGNLIQQQFVASRDWPFGATISLCLMVLTLIGLFLLPRPRQELETS